MESSNFLITNYINKSNSDNIDQLKKNLFKLGILSKDYPDDNMLLLFNYLLNLIYYWFINSKFISNTKVVIFFSKTQNLYFK